VSVLEEIKGFPSWIREGDGLLFSRDSGKRRSVIDVAIAVGITMPQD
jgi:hypothetical protein